MTDKKPENSEQHPQVRVDCALGGITTYIGIMFRGDSCQNVWQITCPCGVSVKYPVNRLPEVDTPHPCGNPNHWTVKYAFDVTPNETPITGCVPEEKKYANQKR